MTPRPKKERCGEIYHALKTNRCGVAQFTDEKGENIYLCPKCFWSVEKPIQPKMEKKNSKKNG